MKDFIQWMLGIHIAGGALSLIAGAGAMFTSKGSLIHRRFGKAYFTGMTLVFAGALVVGIANQRDFLLMVAFFSYYLAVRGYRILSFKRPVAPGITDWLITGLSGIAILLLPCWGIYMLLHGVSMGLVGIFFGIIGLSFIVNDIRNYRRPPTEKMHWWYSHIASMGGSYIAAVTAFVVVNIQLPTAGWILWVLPGVIGGILIRRTIRSYKAKFAA